jgi:hypothetical protein
MEAWTAQLIVESFVKFGEIFVGVLPLPAPTPFTL